MGDAGCVLPAHQDALVRLFAALLALRALYCFAHQFCYDGTFVLALKNRVESILNVFGDTEIDGRHSWTLVVENFNNIVMRKD